MIASRNVNQTMWLVSVWVAASRVAPVGKNAQRCRQAASRWPAKEASAPAVEIAIADIVGSSVDRAPHVQIHRTGKRTRRLNTHARQSAATRIYEIEFSQREIAVRGNKLL